LPEGTALVLEGGGTRGFYSAGVFEAFMDAGIMFPYIIGVSAGAANALSYISGQQGRNRQIVEHYVGDPRYVSRRNLLLHRSLFGMKFVFRDVPQKHLFFDWEIYRCQDIRFLTGAFDCRGGETVWFDKRDADSQIDAVMASCALPMLSPIVRYEGYDLLDGGVADPIPIKKSIADGNTFHVVVLTQNKGYVKEAFTHKRLLKLMYRKYPWLVEAIMTRHEAYNRQLGLCERLEKEGQAVIIRPSRTLQVKRSETDTKKLLALHDEGHEEGREQLERFYKTS
jgi:predicted patatin/cPLA2 family phospholipase